MRVSLLSIIALLITCLSLEGQAIAKKGSSESEAFQKQYEKNIKLSRINGVYIPASLKDAFNRLKSISPKESLVNFKAAEEDIVCEKLHFGLGRWMIINWNFYDGSRLSHLLKGKGVRHPDDMAQFLLHTFHRYLNEKDLDEETLANQLSTAREKATKAKLGIEINKRVK